LGPCIGQAQFEVGGEVFDAFVTENRVLAKYFVATVQGKFLADLCGIAREQLLALGASQVTGGGWCTVSDPRLASYRQSSRLNQPSGRFATVAMLRPLA
jgi:polyphenol oxidase